MDPLQILSRLEENHPSPPTDVELTAAADALKDALNEATSAEVPDLTIAKQIREAIDLIKVEQGKRETAAESNREAARALREGIFDDAAPEGGNETPAEDETPTEEPVVEDKAPIAAGARDLVSALTTSLKSRVPAQETQKTMHGASIKSVGPAASFDLDSDAGFRELGNLFSQHGRSQTGKGVAVPLVRLERSYPENRILGENSQLNARRLADALGTGLISQAPIAASGGICGPGDVDHTHPICSERGRVVTTALPTFNASRGTLTYPPSISIGDLAGGITVWTAANDANPTSPTTKACPPLECVEELTASVDAVVQCVTVGNFQAKFSPEWWSANLEVLAAAHDRAAEQKALTELFTLSDSIGTVNEGSTVWNFLQMINNVISADRSARRNWTGRYTVIADAYLKDQLRNQLIANLGSGPSPSESIQVADSIIDGWITDAGATAVWTYDGTWTGSAHRVIANSSQSGHLPPADAGVLIFPEDAFIFLDGGTLDLGTEITDSTLNATNDRQAFAETFEKVAKRGCSAFHGVVTIDASCGCGLTSI